MYRRYRRVFTVLFVFALLSQLIIFAKKLPDTQPPTAPGNLTAAAAAQTSVSLTWSASSDNRKITAYLVYRNNVYLGSTGDTVYTVSGLTAATAYTFYVMARDTSGNLSKPSNLLGVTTAPVFRTASRIVAGYYASWSAYSGYTPLDVPASRLTHLNYAFATIDDDLKIAPGDPYVDLSNFALLRELKQSFPPTENTHLGRRLERFWKVLRRGAHRREPDSVCRQRLGIYPATRI